MHHRNSRLKEGSPAVMKGINALRDCALKRRNVSSIRCIEISENFAIQKIIGITATSPGLRQTMATVLSPHPTAVTHPHTLRHVHLRAPRSCAHPYHRDRTSYTVPMHLWEDRAPTSWYGPQRDWIPMQPRCLQYVQASGMQPTLLHPESPHTAPGHCQPKSVLRTNPG